MKIDYMNNPEFHEEQQHLDKTLDVIEKHILSSTNRIDELRDKIKHFGAVYEPSDIDAKQSMLDDVNYESTQRDEYSAIKSSPYFGRIDLEQKDNSEEKAYYIGSKGIGNADKRIILDWRSKIGNLYYDRDHKNFTVNGNEYKLILRRSIQIKNELLKSVHTDYYCYDLDSDSEVIDAFLIAVLKEKRRDKKLTDIIKTIQTNQNRIIRRNIKDSFIVQGCAGSGKTMVLLHRLSYILYNNKNLNKSKLMIITPNEYFNNHLDELSRHLDIDEIPRYTTEELYSWIISLYRIYYRNEGVLPKTIGKKIDSEGMLNEQLLSLLYSAKFTDEISTNWDEYFSQVELSIYNELGEYINRYGVDSVKNKGSYYSRYLSIIEIVQTIESRASKATTKLDILNKQLTGCIIKRSQNQQNLSEARERYEEQLPKIKRLINEFIAEKENIINEHQNDVLSVDEKIRRCNTDLVSMQNQIDNIRRRKEQVSRICDFSLKTIETAKDPLYISIRDVKKDDIKEIENIISVKENLSFFRFLEKNKLGKEETRRTKELSYYAGSQKDKVLRGLSRQISDIEAQYNKQSLEAEALRNKKASINAKINQTVSMLADATELKAIINNPDGEFNEGLISKLNLPTDIIRYKKSLDVATDELVSTDRRIQQLSEDINKENSLIFNDNDQAVIANINDMLKRISIEAEKEYFEYALKKAYSRYSERYLENRYRHQRYLMTYWLNLYYGSIGTNYFVSIDEAQDLSESEYMLLKRVFGEQTIFNLYGDINQGIYSYRGSGDWKHLDGISESIEYLNENYRNAIEITSYCNDEFGMQMTPIGLQGGRVDKLGLLDSIESLVNSLREDMTCAIICKNTQDFINNVPADKSIFVVNGINNNKISVITPELAKGLEFNHVAVVPDGMDFNNKYVAYTRALERLTIVG